MKKTLEQTPFFLFLVPFFFILHGYTENFGNITVANCLSLLLAYAGAAALLYFIFLFFFRNYIKAALMAIYLFGFYCFFGAIHDFLKLHSTFLYKYSILLLVFFIGFIILFIFFKKTKHFFFRTTLFINVLLLVYIIFDTGSVILKYLNPGPNKLSVYSFAKNNPYKNCESCPKPDIYFLLFDEYASSLSLKQNYNYDNSGLDTFLRQSDFSIQANSHSNYNFTPFSMSSILNMSYIKGIDPQSITSDDYAYCTNLIRNNEVIKFLSYQGYDIVNYSVFDLAGNPSRVDQSLLPLKTKLITDRTLFAYLRKDIGWMIYTGRFELKWLTAHTTYTQLNNNNKFIDLVEKESAVKAAKPRFIYMHVYMPHTPFFFDENKKLKDPATVYREYKELPLQAYLDYLPYTNSRIKELITTIKKNTDGNAVIVFMGDHGLRYHANSPHPDKFFQNQNAIYFPDKDYHLLKDSVTGVNQFRIIFNKLFNEKIPLLQDSTVFLKDKHN